MKKLTSLKLNKETVSLLTENHSLSTTDLKNVVGGDDFDTPTINDNCFGRTGWTTFGSNCEWCGFWHETC